PGAEAGLICLPGGTLNNCADLWLLPGQHLLIDLHPDDATPEALVALIPAEGVLGHGGAYRTTLRQPLEVIIPLFDEEEAIWAASGILLHCPAVAEGAGRAPQSDYFTQLTVAQTRAGLSRRAGLAREAAGSRARGGGGHAGAVAAITPAPPCHFVQSLALALAARRGEGGGGYLPRL
ncbi:MAG: hypothetical protein U1D06_13195, partial [Paracoccaceae bacterium]|nr:hypothetical protein [Paracoccaceae bacterium]